MFNSYADVTTFKSDEYANISTNTEQVAFRQLLESASRHLDRRCHRWFYVWEGTRYYDGKSGHLVVDDLLDVDSVKLDLDGDGVFETTMAPYVAAVYGDYLLYPLNKYPKQWLELSPNSNQGSFGSDPRSVEIDGWHGYGDGESATPYYTSGQTVIDAPLTAVAVVLTVTSTTNLGAGMTLRIETEQIYIERIINPTTCTIRRAANGTTAAAHVATTPISIYEYPAPIMQATLVLAMKAWKRKDSAFQDAVGSAETGLVVAFKDEDPLVKGIIKDYMRYV